MSTSETVRADRLVPRVHLTFDGQGWVWENASYEPAYGAVHEATRLFGGLPGVHFYFHGKDYEQIFPRGVTVCVEGQRWRADAVVGPDRVRGYGDSATWAFIDLESNVRALREAERGSRRFQRILAELHKLFDEGRKLVEEIKGYKGSLEQERAKLPMDRLTHLQLKGPFTRVYEGGNGWYVEGPGLVGPFPGFFEALAFAVNGGETE